MIIASRMLLLAFTCFAATSAFADSAAQIEISHAWTRPAVSAGADIPLYMAITNHGDEADTLLRARCPISNFAEQRTTDHGEGAPSDRTIKSIRIPASTTVTLAPDGLHLMLLQTTQSLKKGDSFLCHLTFKAAGAQEVQVVVTDQD